MSELKPCPFCGGEAFIRKDVTHSTAYFFGCANEECPGNDLWHFSRKVAVEKWNTRADLSDALLREAIQSAEAERDALRAVLEEIADGLKGIARDIQIGPDDEGREIYDMVQAMQWDARQALKGQTNE